MTVHLDGNDNINNSSKGNNGVKVLYQRNVITVSTAVIAGGIAGAIVLILVIVIIYCACRKNRTCCNREAKPVGNNITHNNNVARAANNYEPLLLKTLETLETQQDSALYQDPIIQNALKVSSLASFARRPTQQPVKTRVSSREEKTGLRMTGRKSCYSCFECNTCL